MMLNQKFKNIFFAILLLSNPIWCLAQSASETGEVEVEELYDRLGEDEVKKSQKNIYKPQGTQKKPSTLSELTNLEPISDVAIMQRRFLPTSGRFELGTQLVMGMNNPFFSNYGAALTATYFITTAYAIDAQYFALSPTKKDISKNLENERLIHPYGVFAKGFYGAAFRWTPFYGKLTFLNDRLTHYDTYLLVGAGITNTEVEDATTIQLGVGQTYALSKTMAIKIDLTMHRYTARAVALDTNAAGTGNASQSDIYLTVGTSFYFPEATYR